jgi:hypothetical protein
MTVTKTHVDVCGIAVCFPEVTRHFSRFESVWYPHSYVFTDTDELFSVVWLSGCQIEHSHHIPIKLSYEEVQFPSIPPYYFMARTRTSRLHLVKHLIF